MILFLLLFLLLFEIVFNEYTRKPDVTCSIPYERIGHNAECANQSPIPWQQLIFEWNRAKWIQTLDQNLATSITIIVDIKWSWENKLWKKLTIRTP